jgi:hypothetical protein
VASGCQVRRGRVSSYSGHVSSYRVSVGNGTVRVKAFREVGPVVMDALTTLLAQDPEAVSRDVMVANHMFTSGAVERAVTAHGSWHMSATAHGEPIRVVVVKKRWWRRRGSFNADAALLSGLLAVRVRVVCWPVRGCLLLGCGE